MGPSSWRRKCDEPGPASWGRTNQCDSGTDSDDCCPPHAHSSANLLQCACNSGYRVDEPSVSCVPASPPPPPPPSSRTVWQRCDAECDELEDNAERRQQCREDCREDTPEYVWAFAYPACWGSMIALMIGLPPIGATADAVGGDCGNHTTSCTTNCQTLVSRMVSDCAALEQALTANDTTMMWWVSHRVDASYVSFRTAILSDVPADCVVEPAAATQQPEQPHRRADGDCSRIDDHASMLVPAVVLACILCASAMCVAFACCKKKERTGHEKAGLLNREAHM